MRKKTVFYISLFLIQSVFGQVTFVVNDLPENTPENASIYISGDFEGWSGGNESYKLTKKNNTFFITIPKNQNVISYKFTQGTWDLVERDIDGNQIDNRNYKFKKENDTVAIKIARWDKGNDLPKSTRADNVFILSEDFEIPQLNQKRRIWMYLPPNYKTANKSFPVIYMHDGQNLFDSNTSYSGEWSVDETLNRLYKDSNASFIVVAIDNGKDKRLDEYSPWKNKNYGGGQGDAYLEFIVKTLKPYIDSNYKTLTDKENTAIIGSSMGGLISHYAALKYPRIFGKIGVYSPAFWFTPEISKFSKTNGNIQDTKMYFLAGGKEGDNAGFKEISNTATDMNSIMAILKESGFPSKNMQSKVVLEGKHNEELWRNNFEEAITWLFKDTFKKREFINAKLKDNQLQVNVTDGTYTIQFYSPEITETTFLPTGKKVLFNKSHAVVLKETFSNITYKEDSVNVTFNSKDLCVLINKKPFQISYYYKDKLITSEKRGYYKSTHEPMEMVQGNMVAGETEKIEFNLLEDEVLYGGGARALGMNRRGNRLPLFNRAHYGYETKSKLMNFTMPIVLSSNKYMIHFDNAPIGYLDLDSKRDNTLTYETISGRKTYQVIVGKTWYDIMNNYTNLTGKQPMLPRWALGNFSSRFGYHSQKEIETTIGKFRDEKIPVDAIILDLYWFGKDIKGTMGNLEVFRDSFPDFEGMVNRLNNKGVKTITITEPFILTTSSKWDEAVKEDILAKDTIGNPAKYDFYFGNTGIIDIYKPKGEQWFWNIYKNLANKGVAGVWGDLGEPEVHPNWVQHHTGSANQVHNIYGHDWARLVYKGYQRDFPNTRPFILMRAGYSGSQQYGMIPWSGDVNRTWGGLQSQPEIALQMSMQGMAYMHSDLGGFAGDNLDDELYVRWLQYGVFNPIFRPHAQEGVASEPVFRSEKAKRLAKFAIQMRYRMLPYNYNLMYENHTSGKPLMRPLFFEEPNNPKLFSYSKTYLWGNDILVSPVLEAGKKEQEVYFPKTSNWFNIETDKIIKGGQTKMIKTHPAYIPTYVRGGAFIPLTNSIQSTSEYDNNSIELHHYFDKSAPENKLKLFSDNGSDAKTIDNGDYEVLEFKSNYKGMSLMFEFELNKGTAKASEKAINLYVHNIQNEPKLIMVDGEKIKIKWNAKTKVLTIPATWKTSTKKEIKIKLKR